MNGDDSVGSALIKVLMLFARLIEVIASFYMINTIDIHRDNACRRSLGAHPPVLETSSSPGASRGLVWKGECRREPSGAYREIILVE